MNIDKPALSAKWGQGDERNSIEVTTHMLYGENGVSISTDGRGHAYIRKQDVAWLIEALHAATRWIDEQEKT